MKCHSCGYEDERWLPTCHNCYKEQPLQIPPTVDLKPFVKAIFHEEFEVSREAVQKLIALLTPRGQLIVVYYYGLDGGERLVDRRIGEDFLGVRKQAVNRVRLKWIKYLCHPTRAKILVESKIGS